MMILSIGITEITSGEYEGLLKRGDYHEYHPSDQEIVGFQLNSSSDDMMLDALPGWCN